MKNTLVISLAALALAACAAPVRDPVATGAPRQTQRFDRTEAAAALVRGTGMVRGASLFRTAGRDSASCAGNDVWLIPATPYTDERMNLVFGPGTTTLMRPDSLGTAGQPEPAPPAWLETTLQARCDSRGNFHFDQVGPGAYWIRTSVRWKDGDVPQGGLVALRIAMQPGQTVNVLLSP